MKKQLFISLLAAAALTVGSGAYAQDASKGEAAAKASKCLGCHSADKDGDAPSYKKISAKFKKDAAKVTAAFDKVEDHAKVKKSVKPDDLKNIVAWIVSM